MAEKNEITGLALLRVPFAANQISKLPKPTKAQTDAVRNDFKAGIRCKECGAWHHKDVVHLDYVGHAALTDRLLECDLAWNWEPVATSESGEPSLDKNGGMWIRLSVCGVTRLGYGHADGKSGGDAVKEVIGDALRNAAMRFGAALDLWHKGDLHGDDIVDDRQHEPSPKPAKARTTPAKTDHAQSSSLKAKTLADDMIFAAKKYGVAAVTENNNFPSDIEWLEINSPDEFERVQAALNPTKDTPAKHQDEIPYQGETE